LGLEKRGMGEGEGGVLEWVRVIAVNCKVFFLGRWSFVLYFSKRGGEVSFLSCWFPRGYRSVWVVGCAGSYLARCRGLRDCHFFPQNPLFGIVHPSFLQNPLFELLCKFIFRQPRTYAAHRNPLSNPPHPSPVTFSFISFLFHCLNRLFEFHKPPCSTFHSSFVSSSLSCPL